MPENRALSQWEIDALLNQIPEGEPDGEPEALDAQGLGGAERRFSRTVKPYDFRRPDKFSKEQWASFQSMHETFARLVSASFSSRMRTLVSVRLSSIGQGLYEEWQAQVPTQTACYVLSLRPLSGNIVVEFNSDVASEVIDRLLGGSGVLIDRGREPGEVELALLRSFSTVICGAIEEMWSAVTPVRCELQDLGRDASLVQVASPNEAVLTAFFEVNVGNHLGAMSICVPYTVIEPLAPRLSVQRWFSSGKPEGPTDEDRRHMEALITPAKVDLSVALGGATVPAWTITQMQPGDTLVLDARAGQPLPLMVGERPRFQCLPGMVGNRLAVKVTAALPREGTPSAVPDAAGAPLSDAPFERPHAHVDHEEESHGG